MKGVEWSVFDPIVAAAFVPAQKAGDHLFKAKVLADAIKSLEKADASKFYPFLVLLNKKDPTAVAVREAFEDLGIDKSDTYTVATETAVRELVKPPNNPPPKFYLAAEKLGFKDMDVESANKVLEHAHTLTDKHATIFDKFLVNLVRLAAKDRVDATGPLDLFASAEKVAEASKGKGMKPSNTYAPYLRGLDFLDKKSDFSTFKAAYSETNAWKKLPRRGPAVAWRKNLKRKVTKEATAAREIQKLLVALGIERAGYTRTTWAAAYDARWPSATDDP